ncbi:MAG: DUF1292 domain-containing protein [Anaerotignum sp.]|nr:DUF1292 domain-containing protein [Anaerotignum sp.]
MNEDRLNELETEPIDTVVYLTDEEDGTEYVFECLDTVEYEDNEYAVMLPLDDADDGYVLVMQIEYNEEEAEFCVIVEDEAVVDAVFDLFKEQNADLFEFDE